MPPPAVCIRCRRQLEDEPDGVVLQLDGRPMLDALRSERAAAETDEDRELLDQVARGLCPACGRAL